MVCGNSQARSKTLAAVAGLGHSRSHEGSKLEFLIFFGLMLIYVLKTLSFSSKISSTRGRVLVLKIR